LNIPPQYFAYFSPFIYRKMKKIYILSHLITLSFILTAQPKPTDIFREYTWATPKPTANGQELFLRVCSDGFYDDAVRKGEHLFPKGYVNDGWFTLPQDIDLKDAVRAEILVERMLCHDGSTGLAVKFNAGEWHAFPDADSIPKPQSEYLYHYYPIVSVPLTTLKTGANANQFRFTIDKKQRWGMPQNMVYGMVVRVYYKATKPHAEADISTLKSGDVMGEKVDLNIQSKSPFSKVEYVGLMENINYEGDGRYHQWHYNYHRGELVNHIGTSTTGALTWNTEWIPEQPKPMQIAARVTDANGVIYMTKAVENLGLKRPYKVELCKPFSQPRRWATREMEYVEMFDVKGNVKNVEKFQITAVTWSPGYLNGIYLNDFLLMDRESCKYCYHIIKKDIEHPEFLSTMNGLKTGKTPLYGGKMQHGTEIQYPGFMVLVKYKSE
jgi:hypothetical protein